MRLALQNVQSVRSERMPTTSTDGTLHAFRTQMIKTDLQLKTDIETELRSDPRVNSAQIGVTVDRGAVSLLGAVETFAEKFAAEDAAKRVSGVRTLAQDLTVKLTSRHKRADSEIAAAILRAIEWDVHVPKTITAKVQDGMVILEGECAWNYEREAAERAIRHLTGITAVFDSVVIRPTTSAEAILENVEAALQRQATADAHSIKIATSGSTVTLSGHAASWRSMHDASKAAWAAPGVTNVIDRMTLSVA